MKKFPFFLPLAVALALLAGAIPATAATMTVNESGVVYNNIQAFAFGPDAAFNGTGLSNFTVGVWTITLNASNWAEAADGVIGNTNFDVNLTMSGPGYLDLFAFNGLQPPPLDGSTIVDSARFGWDINGYTGVILGTIPGAPLVYQQDVAAAAPEPATWVLLTVGLLLCIVSLRRRAC